MAEDVALLGVAAGAASVVIVAVPENWPQGWDIADPLPAGVAPEALSALLQSAVPWTPTAQHQPSGEVDSGAEIARLGRLPLIEYGRERKAVAQRLGCPVAILDKAVAAERGNGEMVVGQSRPLDLAAPEAWPEPVDGAALLEAVVTAIRQYVVFSEAQAIATNGRPNCRPPRCCRAVPRMLKDIAPSTDLRRWFGHDPSRWDEFRVRYKAELSHRHASEGTSGTCPSGPADARVRGP